MTKEPFEETVAIPQGGDLNPFPPRVIYNNYNPHNYIQ